MLKNILAHKYEEVRQLREKLDPGQTAPRQPHPDLPEALRRGERLKIIAEVKKASPSRGLLCEDFDPLRLARLYQQNGAAAISVLSDVRFFQGSPRHVQAVKEAVTVPVLRKDFIVDEIQLYETLNLGADLVLLIAGVLDYSQLLALTEKARELGLELLLETHSLQEVKMAGDLPVKLVGINNRNLSSFSVNLGTSLDLAGHLPAGVVKVSESGIKSPRDLKLLEEHGFDAVLLGESLVTAESPGLKLRELLSYQEI